MLPYIANDLKVEPKEIPVTGFDEILTKSWDSFCSVNDLRKGQKISKYI